jgi:integration host factor subunit alpha
MMALTKAGLVQKLYEQSGFTQRESKEIVEFFFEALRTALEAGESVKLSGFGKFSLREKKPRPGRNPKTGVEIPITARRVVIFRPGQKLRTRVEAHAGSSTLPRRAPS